MKAYRIAVLKYAMTIVYCGKMPWLSQDLEGMMQCLELREFLEHERKSRGKERNSDRRP
jgi:hypothetical protein